MVRFTANELSLRAMNYPEDDDPADRPAWSNGLSLARGDYWLLLEFAAGKQERLQEIAAARGYKPKWVEHQAAEYWRVYTVLEALLESPCSDERVSEALAFADNEVLRKLLRGVCDPQGYLTQPRFLGRLVALRPKAKELLAARRFSRNLPPKRNGTQFNAASGLLADELRREAAQAEPVPALPPAVEPKPAVLLYFRLSGQGKYRACRCGGTLAAMTGPKVFRNGAGRHAGSLRCTSCGRHLAWLQQGEVEQIAVTVAASLSAERVGTMQ